VASPTSPRVETLGYVPLPLRGGFPHPPHKKKSALGWAARTLGVVFF